MANLIINLSTTTSTQGYIYKDISFPISDDFTANFDTNAVKQSISNIFSWRRGQRILDPLFGNVIYEYVYEPINDITLKNLRNSILDMLKYEPRIDIISLDLTPSPDENAIYVKLQYLIPKLNMLDSYSTTIEIISR